MYKVVIETWVEPEWECGDGCCWEPPEQRWRVVETDIPWESEYWHSCSTKTALPRLTVDTFDYVFEVRAAPKHRLQWRPKMNKRWANQKETA